MSIRVLDMFCGMSAFRSAAEKIGGFEFVGYCDNDPTAIAAYRTLYSTEGEIYYDNARTVNTDEIPDFDLLVGGFPCVAFSAAGRRLAFKDERGTLFFELARILEAKRPAFFVFENVPPIRTIQKGQVFTAILSEISRLGYVCEWQCVDGSAYLPQSRKRVFIVGYLDSRCAGEILPLERKSGTPLSELTDKASQGNRVYDAKGAAITLTASCGGFGGKTGMYFVDMNENSKITDTARCITARHNAGLSNRKGEHSGVFVEDDGVYGYDESADYSQNTDLWFQTAWSAPHPILQKLSEMYPDITFEHEWADEDIGANCGRKCYQNGECTEEYYPESQKEAIEFACRIWDYDPAELDLMQNKAENGYINIENDEYDLISLFGKPALFTNERLTDADIPKGLYCYHLRHSDDGCSFATVEPKVKVNHGGSIITDEPIDFGEQGYIAFTEDTEPNFMSENMTFGEYMRGEFDQSENESQQIGGMRL